MALKLRSVSLNLPFGLGGVEVDVSEGEARAAWHLYVEFATRVTGHPLAAGAGSVKEALDSLHSLFVTTRPVLREAGPEVAEGSAPGSRAATQPQNPPATPSDCCRRRAKPRRDQRVRPPTTSRRTTASRRSWL
jgi:hypothetical protein